MRDAVVETRDIDTTGISSRILAQTVGVSFQLMCLEIHLGIEYNELLFQTFLVRTHEMILAEMELKSIVVEIVLRLSSTVPSITYVAALVSVATMCVELVVTIEALSAETALGVALETGLVYCTGVVVAVLLMLAKLGRGKKLMLVGEDLLVAGAQIAHGLVMDALDVSM